MKVEFIISTIIASLLWLSVMHLTNSIFTSSGKTTMKEHVKVRAEALADVIEIDLNRIGFGVPGNGIVAADSSSISFNSNYDNDGEIKNITWFFTNMEDSEWLAVRMVDSVYTDYLVGITDFRFGYRNALMQPANSLSEIRHVEMFIMNSTETANSSLPERHAIFRVVSPRNIQLSN
jgi:hypothetical protein